MARITSAASHLFGLMLLLALEPSGTLSRRHIQALLFGTAGGRSASHNLRQLLYRIRRSGLTLDERGGALALNGARIVTPLQLLRSRSPEQRSRLTATALVPLPGWAPKLPPAFVDWLDEQRHGMRRQVLECLTLDIGRAKAGSDWQLVNRIAALLLDLEPDHVASSYARAEALSMLCRRQEALDVVDRAVRNSGIPHVRAELQKFRGRIERQPMSRVQPRLHGRQDCMTFLWDQWEQCQASARLVVLLGPPGIGKTRVADELSAAARLRGVTVIQHRCEGSARAYPLSLFAQVLPDLRAKRGSLGATPAHLAVLERLRPSNPTSPYEIPRGESLQALRTEIQDALIDVIEAVSAEAPLLLIVDDAHLLDRSSAAILRALSSGSNAAHLMILANCRPSAEAQHLLAPSERTASFPLAPLAPPDSRALLAELTGHLNWSSEYFETCLREADGNPFYLNALSRVEPGAQGTGSHGFDVQSLGASSYFSLDASARLVLESCLLLGSLATLERLRSITEVDEIGLIGAIRTLEERGVVSLVNDQLRGPHALLEAVILGLIPPGVLRLLRSRVAGKLAAECESQGYSMPLALAAAENWLAAGEDVAAVSLLKRGAAHVAAVGEPAVAARMLAQVGKEHLALEDRFALAIDMERYAEAAAERDLVSLALRQQLEIGPTLQLPASTMKAIDVRIIEGTILDGDYASEVTRLRDIAADIENDATVRAKAVTQLLIICDAHLDVGLANAAYSLLGTLGNEGSARLRAELIFHTSFGNVTRAAALAKNCLDRFPHPTDDDECRRSRRYAAMSLYRLMELPDSRRASAEDYGFAASHGFLKEALSTASMLTEIEISAGDFEAARAWFSETKRLLAGLDAHRTVPHSGYISSSTMMALLDGRYEEAEGILNYAKENIVRLDAPRFQPLCDSIRMRASLMRGDALDCRDIAALRAQFERSRSFGNQDSVAEVLWSAILLTEDTASASVFLLDYLQNHRRETGPPEWLLRHTTAADDVWQTYDIDRRLVRD